MILKPFYFAVVAFCIFLMSACAPAQIYQLYPDIGPDDVVISMSASGGCMRGLSTCSSYTLTRSGTLSAFQLGRMTEGVQPVGVYEGAVSQARIEEWLADVADTNFKRLYSSFDKGKCQGCVDGIDISFILLPGNGDHAADSVKYSLASSDNVFSDAGKIIYDAGQGTKQ